MSEEEKRTKVQKSFEHLPGMNCFACAPARLNPDGMNLVFEETSTGAKTRVWLPKRFQSYPGYLHGGIVSGILDETMAYAGVFKLHCLPFTKTLKIDYRLGVSAEREYVCEAEMEEVTPERYTTRSAIRDERGRAVVTGWAEFAIPSQRMVTKMLPIEGIEAFDGFFRPSEKRR